MNFVEYAFISSLYIAIIHFAIAIKKQFDLFQMIGIFCFGAIIGYIGHSYEIGLFLSIILSLLFW